MDEKFRREIKEMLENKVREEAASLLGEKVDAINELLALQEKSCTCDYQIGLYNGLAIGLSVLTGEEPKFFDFGNINVREEVETCIEEQHLRLN